MFTNWDRGLTGDFDRTESSSGDNTLIHQDHLKADSTLRRPPDYSPISASLTSLPGLSTNDDKQPLSSRTADEITLSRAPKLHEDPIATKGKQREDQSASNVVKALSERLTVVFGDVQQYRQLLRYRGADAQGLLDIFQAVRTLTRLSIFMH